MTRPYARRTSRQQGLVRHLGLALGGRPAQALAGRLLPPVSKDTLLRNVRKAVGSSRLVGIDDWAWCKGQRYGTLICDLERRQVIDLLPDREPAIVEAWPRASPDIEIVARDRNGGYGGAVARALPEAVQVADRWHLLENGSAAFLAAVQRSMPAIRKAIEVRSLDPKLLTAAERLQYEGFQRRRHADPADRSSDRVEQKARTPDSARRTRRGVSHPREQPAPLAAPAGVRMEWRLPKWSRTLAAAARRRVTSVKLV